MSEGPPLCVCGLRIENVDGIWRDVDSTAPASSTCPVDGPNGHAPYDAGIQRRKSRIRAARQRVRETWRALQESTAIMERAATVHRRAPSDEVAVTMEHFTAVAFMQAEDAGEHERALDELVLAEAALSASVHP